jgi:hypothetical protein
MACDCGHEHQREFPASVSYSVYFDRGRKTIAAQWTADSLFVCVNCGEISSRIPDQEIGVLREGGGESVV